MGDADGGPVLPVAGGKAADKYVPGHEKILPFVGVALFRSRLLRALRTDDRAEERALRRDLDGETLDRIDSDVRDALVEETLTLHRATSAGGGGDDFSVRNHFVRAATQRVAPADAEGAARGDPPRSTGERLDRWTNAFADEALEADYAACLDARAAASAYYNGLVAIFVVAFFFVDAFGPGGANLTGRIVEWLYLLFFPASLPLQALARLTRERDPRRRFHRVAFAAALAVLLAGGMLKLARRSAALSGALADVCGFKGDDDGSPAAFHAKTARRLPAEAAAAVGALLIIVADGVCAVAVADVTVVFGVSAVGVFFFGLGQALAALELLGGAAPPTPSYYVVLAAISAVLLAVGGCRKLDAHARSRWASLRDATGKRLAAEARLVHAHRDAAESERRACGLLKQTLAVQAKAAGETVESIAVDSLALDRVLGEGTFGEAILAEWRGSKVVWKRMARKHITRRNMEILADELLVMSPLRHPNVVLLLGACFDEGANVGMVLEYAARGDLLTVLEQNRADASFGWDDPLRRMAQDVARGLAYLHGRSPPVVHRDLKSPNVLVSHTYSCKLADFGLSKLRTAEARGPRKAGSPIQRTACVGTPPYMAPELIRGDAGDEAVDLYAFGVVLVEMANRAPPYSTPSDPAIGGVAGLLDAVDRGLRPALVGEMPAPIKAVADACLRADRTARPTAHDAVLAFVSVPRDADGRQRRRSTDLGGAAPVAPRPRAGLMESSLWTEEDCDLVGSLY